jgi:lipoprotein-anchoring transpeptidase ErfK/SrfK
MYWYVKYPLYAVLIAILLWIGYGVFKKFAPERGLPEVMQLNETGSEDSSSAPTPGDAAGTPPETRMGEGGWAHLKPVTELEPAKPDEVASFLRQAVEQMNGDNLLASRNLCYRILAASSVKPFSDAWWKTVDVLGKVNLVFFKTDAPCPEKVRYAVQAGDTLIGIANAYETTVEAIQQANGLAPANSSIYPGMILNIYVGEWSIDVSKANFALILYDSGRIFKVYRVGIGKQDRTPVGEFVIKNKIREPDWTPPGRRIPFGDPENVLGTRWLGLIPVGDTDPTLRGYGIHGTWQPESIGTAASQGCIRLENGQVNELFDIIPYPPPMERLLEKPETGTPVKITNE